jgi:PIN domain nuclease of toxin-antitoxin system
MAAVVHLDTHVVVWSYADPQGRIPAAVRQRLDGATLRISPMVALELQYLNEIGRLAPLPAEILGYLKARIGLEFCSLPFADAVEGAREHSWTRDPFDRLIVGQAVRAGAALATADELIRTHCPSAFWT